MLRSDKLFCPCQIRFLLAISLLISMAGLHSCAYYNTFYNAEQYFAEARKLTKENQSETVSSQEINLYSKAIEKSKKLLQGYPDSKYRDDAQFLIAKSHYYKGDYLLAKRYFEDLALHYKTSPHTEEVPLWIGRCLLEVGDLEMARHEASRIIKDNVSRALQADALLLMGEIAVRQDSLALAENYLEQVIDRSPDGFTKAQAQFQVGKMRENQEDYQGALQAYKSVSRYKPSESLKVEAIIRQTNMLKALNRDEDAVNMIKGMLISDKFVDIRGQLEVELGKLYLVMGELDQAEAKLKSIVEDYSRQEVAAEADYVLGELYLNRRLDYKAARAAYSDIKIQAVRSPLVKLGAERNKQISRYEKIQFDYLNLERQLSGLAPLVKEKKKKSAKGRGSRSGRSRGRSRSVQPGNPAAERNPAKIDKPKENTSVELVLVMREDSLRYLASMDENRYALAEYMLFEFSRVDSAMDILKTLEAGSLDSAIRQQSAYMQYYALESIKGDVKGGQQVLEHILEAYPNYYATVMNTAESEVVRVDSNDIRFQDILRLFDKGDFAAADLEYLRLKKDSTLSKALRGKAYFNSAWLNDHFLFNKDAALESYQFMIDNFPTEPLTKTARARLEILSQAVPQIDVVPDEDPSQGKPDHQQEQKIEKDLVNPKAPKKGEKGRK